MNKRILVEVLAEVDTNPLLLPRLDDAARRRTEESKVDGALYEQKTANVPFRLLCQR